MADFLTLIEFKAALRNAGGEGARTAAELNDDRLDAHLADAHAEVNGRLERTFTIAVDGPTMAPPLLKAIVGGIAGYTATLEFWGSVPVEERDPVVLRYKRAMELLDRIARGDLVVAGVTTTDGSTNTGEPAIYDGVPDTGLASGWELSERRYDPTRETSW